VDEKVGNELDALFGPMEAIADLDALIENYEPPKPPPLKKPFKKMNAMKPLEIPRVVAIREGKEEYKPRENPRRFRRPLTPSLFVRKASFTSSPNFDSDQKAANARWQPL